MYWRSTYIAANGANRLSEGKLLLCAETCSTKALLAGDGEIIAQIYKERVLTRGYGLRSLGLEDRLWRRHLGVSLGG